MKAGLFLERRRVAITWILAVAFFLLASPRPWSIIAGFLLMAVGASLRTWASGHIRKQEKLAMAGPYAFSRNPLYLGSFLMAAGGLVMGRNWWLVLLFGLFVVPLYHTVMRREEAFLEERFGEDFQAYRQAVPLFLPRLTPYLRGGDLFDWSLVRRHREWYVWAGIGGVTLLLAARYYWL
jgi:protein-S-isoprenylcysteine O-methyltransferase Ste14